MHTYDSGALGSIIGIIATYIIIAMRPLIGDKNTNTMPFIIGFISMGMLSAIIVVYSADNYQYRNQLSAIIATFAMVNILIGIKINKRRDDVTRGPALLYIYGGLLILGVLLFMTIFV